MRTFIAIIVLALSCPVMAQERAAESLKGIAATQDETSLTNQLNLLKSQLQALNAETQRRMACQHTTRVSTATGCSEIPGLEAAVAGGQTIVSVTQQVISTQTALPAYCEENPHWAGCPGCNPSESACYDPNVYNYCSGREC